MDHRLPLTALLSQVLVAFTVEFDNEFEHLVPHRTTNHGSTGDSRSDPWLVSMAMWLHFMQFVPKEGIEAKELYRLTKLPQKTFRTFLLRMSKWWGYVSLSESSVRPTPGGLKALETWRLLIDALEKRWRKRFGPERIDLLRDELQHIVQTSALTYPDFLPILGYELRNELLDSKSDLGRKTFAVSSARGLPVLLSQVLWAFAVEFERDSDISLAVCANLLRLAQDRAVRVRDIPRLSGVSKEATAMVLRRAQECGLGVIQNRSRGDHVKTFVLSSKGLRARERYSDLMSKIETAWKTDVGGNTVAKLRELLEHLVNDASPHQPLIFQGLKPYADGWRASVPPLENLPHFPMVLHRGGFPDGS